MTYIAHSIGDDYKKWAEGDIIFISAPTGSGKTTFILKDFLPTWNITKGKVLYLVNRKILKEQLKEKVKYEVINRNDPLCGMIDIKTYQEIEQESRELIWNPNINMFITKELDNPNTSIFQTYASYGCVICDECHYFLMDSNYNTNNIYSYRIIQELFKDKLRVFMSATIDDIKEQIEHDFRQTVTTQSSWLKLQRQMPGPINYNDSNRWRFYSLDANYDYVDIHIIKNTDEIPKLVTEDNSKWLIFVDSISKGQELTKRIAEYIDDDIKKIEECEGDEENKKQDRDEVQFISAEYINDPEAVKEVEKIIHQNKQSARILIATAVLDNGINIEDIELRNLVILADAKTEFIQMLGRKRKDGNKVKVYICSKSEAHFIRRQNNIKKQLELALEIKGRIGASWFCAVNNPMYNYQQKQNIESQLILWEHQILMKRIMDRHVRMRDVRAIFVERAGILHLNLLSVQNLMNLNHFYEKIIKRFKEEGEDAFLREQLEWLGIESDKINTVIQESKMSRFKNSMRIVNCAFEAQVDKTMSKADNSDFKDSIKDDLKVVCEEIPDETKKKTVMDVLKRNKNVLSKPNIETLREYFGFPYKMEVKDGTYTIRRIEDK